MRRKYRKVLGWDSRGEILLPGVMIMIVLVLFAIIGVVGYQAFADINDDIQSDDMMNSDNKAEVQDLVDRYPRTLDAAFVMIVGLLFFTGLIAAYFAESSPVFLIIVIILLLFTLLAGGMLSNVWEQFSEDGELSGFTNNFPMTDYMLNHLLMIVGVIGISIVGVMYAKNRVV